MNELKAALFLSMAIIAHYSLRQDIFKAIHILIRLTLHQLSYILFRGYEAVTELCKAQFSTLQKGHKQTAVRVKE